MVSGDLDRHHLSFRIPNPATGPTESEVANLPVHSELEGLDPKDRTFCPGH